MHSLFQREEFFSLLITETKKNKFFVMLVQTKDNVLFRRCLLNVRIENIE